MYETQSVQLESYWILFQPIAHAGADIFFQNFILQNIKHLVVEIKASEHHHDAKF